MSSTPTFLDSTPTLISPRTSIKPMPCSTLYCYAHHKPVVERDHHWKRSWISWFRPSWAISLKNLTSLKLWNFILSSTKSQWTPCLPKNSKDTTAWSRLFAALSKTSSSHFWVKSSWTLRSKTLPKPSSTAKSLNSGWENRIHRWNHSVHTLLISEPDSLSSKNGSTSVTHHFTGFLGSSSPKVSWPAFYKTTPESTQFPSMRSSLTSNSLNKNLNSNQKTAPMWTASSSKAAGGIWIPWNSTNQIQKSYSPSAPSFYWNPHTTPRSPTTNITDAPCTRLRPVAVFWARLVTQPTSSCGSDCQVHSMKTTGSREVSPFWHNSMTEWSKS